MPKFGFGHPLCSYFLLFTAFKLLPITDTNSNILSKLSRTSCEMKELCFLLPKWWSFEGSGSYSSVLCYGEVSQSKAMQVKLCRTHRTKIFTFPTLSANRETPPAPDCAAMVLRKRGEGSIQMSSTFFLSSMIGSSCPCRRLSTSFRDVFRLNKILWERGDMSVKYNLDTTPAIKLQRNLQIMHWLWITTN